jgi:hypothetical protein
MSIIADRFNKNQKLFCFYLNLKKEKHIKLLTNHLNVTQTLMMTKQFKFNIKAY